MVSKDSYGMCGDLQKASPSTIKGRSGLGWTCTGAVVNKVFNCEKAISASVDH